MVIGQHQYQPLKEDGAIRILTLDPGKHCEPLRGSLEAIPISSAGSYEALSYVWAQPGPADSAYEILIRNGHGDETILALRGGSIVAALRHLRLPDRPRRIWADQCCINQDDMVERSEQVRLMNRIYRDATQVLVWLGLDTGKEAASAFGLVRELDDILRGPAVPNVALLETRIREDHKTLRALTDRVWVSYYKDPITKDTDH